MTDFRLPKIAILEQKFKVGLVDSAGKKFSVADKTYIPGVIGVRPGKFTDYFYPSVTNKTQIVLHFTAGVLTGDMAALTKNHVSVPYVVGRSGDTYELYNPAFWSYHLGPAATYQNKERSGASVGIEISNIGPLVKSGDVLKDVYGVPYCSIAQTDAYSKVDYRGYSYFANYTDEQYAAISNVINGLSAKFSIKKELLPADTRFSHFKDPPKTGIVTHANYRSDKSDLPPNFDFGKLII